MFIWVLKNYKIQFLQQLEPNELPQRPIFCERALKQLLENPLLYGKTVYVNKRNCRFWSDKQPHAIQKLPLHSEETAIYGLWVGGIVGPFSFREDRGKNVIVNGEGYRAMIRNFMISSRQCHMPHIRRNLTVNDE